MSIRNIKYFICNQITLLSRYTTFVSFSGLIVVGSVCDQTNTNQSSVNCLIRPNDYIPTYGRLLQYTIREKNIIHVWDPPHLLKIIRNNLQNKNLVHNVTKRWDILHTRQNFDDEKQYERCASWSHINEF